MERNRKYPIGIQTFSRIIRDTDNRRVVKVGVRFNAETRVPEEWIISNL